MYIWFERAALNATPLIYPVGNTERIAVLKTSFVIGFERFYFDDKSLN